MRWILLLALCARGWAAVPPADPARWEKEVAQFEARDRTNRPPANVDLFVGSSSIRYWTNLAEMFPDWRVIRRGVGGAHISDMNAYFDRLVLAYRPARIFLYAGENDIAAGRSAEDVVREFRLFSNRVRKELPGTEIYYLSMKPSPSRWYLSPQIYEGNARIRRLAKGQRQVTFVDVGKPLLNSEGRPDKTLFEKDDLHINQKGYERWAREIRRAVGK